MNEAMLTIEDAARRLHDVVERVRAKGEPAILVKSGRPVAQIVPVPSARQPADDLIAFLRRWRAEYPEPDEDFSAVIQESRQCQGLPRDPWGSS